MRLLLLLLLGANARAEEIYAGNLIETDHMTKAFIKANVLDEQMPITSIKIPMTKTVFNIAFNAALCNSGAERAGPVNHTVVISFVEDWSSERNITYKELYENALVLQRMVDTENKWLAHSSGAFRSSKIWVRDFPYKLMIYKNGKMKRFVNEYFRFSMYNSDAQIALGEDSITIRKRRFTSESFAYETIQSFNRKHFRYLVIFANFMGRCPTFISAIDENFPLWVRERSLPKNLGKPRPPKGDPRADSVLHFFQFAVFIVILYIVLLVKLILPTYLEYNDVGGATKVDILDLNYENDTNDSDMPQKTSKKEQVPQNMEVSMKGSIMQAPTKTPLPTVSPKDKGIVDQQPEKTQELSVSRKKKEKKTDLSVSKKKKAKPSDASVSKKKKEKKGDEERTQEESSRRIRKKTN